MFHPALYPELAGRDAKNPATQLQRSYSFSPKMLSANPLVSHPPKNGVLEDTCSSIFIFIPGVRFVLHAEIPDHLGNYT